MALRFCLLNLMSGSSCIINVEKPAIVAFWSSYFEKQIYEFAENSTRSVLPVALRFWIATSLRRPSEIGTLVRQILISMKFSHSVFEKRTYDFVQIWFYTSSISNKFLGSVFSFYFLFSFFQQNELDTNPLQHKEVKSNFNNKPDVKINLNRSITVTGGGPSSSNRASWSQLANSR